MHPPLSGPLKGASVLFSPFPGQFQASTSLSISLSLQSAQNASLYSSSFCPVFAATLPWREAARQGRYRRLPQQPSRLHTPWRRLCSRHWLQHPLQVIYYYSCHPRTGRYRYSYIRRQHSEDPMLFWDRPRHQNHHALRQVSRPNHSSLREIRYAVRAWTFSQSGRAEKPQPDNWHGWRGPKPGHVRADLASRSPRDDAEGQRPTSEYRRLRENPCLARTVDDAETIPPTRAVTRIHTSAGGPQPLRIRYAKIPPQLGSGTFGVVHRAVDVDSGKLIAFKVMQRPGASDLAQWRVYLKREVEFLAELDHVSTTRPTSMRTWTKVQMPAIHCSFFIKSWFWIKISLQLTFLLNTRSLFKILFT